MTKVHATNLAKTNKAIKDSQNTCKDTTEKVEELLSDVQTFMGDFKNFF